MSQASLQGLSGALVVLICLATVLHQEVCAKQLFVSTVAKEFGFMIF